MATFIMNIQIQTQNWIALFALGEFYTTLENSQILIFSRYRSTFWAALGATGELIN